MGFAHYGYKCSRCGGNIASTTEPTWRSSPPYSCEVIDGGWFNGEFLCPACTKQAEAELMEKLEEKYPGSDPQTGIKRAGEFFRAILSDKKVI